MERVLPSGIYIERCFDGYRLYTSKIIVKDTTLGLSHVILEDGLVVKTALGALCRLSKQGNCSIRQSGSKFYLYALEDISGELVCEDLQ